MGENYKLACDLLKNFVNTFKILLLAVTDI